MFFDRRQGAKFLTGLHEFWYRATNGLVGGNIFGARVLLLTTTGRKTGRRHTMPLTYIEDGDRFVIIASNGGADADPDWWRNLRTNSSAMIQIGARHLDVRASAATGDERARIWGAVTKRYPVYRDYERQTTREIPVVVLSLEPG